MIRALAFALALTASGVAWAEDCSKGHDGEFSTLIFAVGVSFLIGFKIAAWMNKQHVKRLKQIWLSGRWRGRSLRRWRGQ
jgi:hypothetical protein